jgi:RNA polymerase sigma-70 factor, ECF subfamily
MTNSSRAYRNTARWGYDSRSESRQVAALYDAYHAPLYRYVLRLAGDHDLAADAVQEAFLRLTERPPRDRSNLRAWLHTVATHYVFDTLKTARRRADLLAASPDRAPQGWSGERPDAAVEAAERRRAVHVAMRSLREKERATLLMRADGFSYREIAAAVGMPVNSVGAIAARALRKLARALEAQP